MPLTIIRRWPIPTRNSKQLQFSSIDISIGDTGVYFPWVGEVSFDMTLEPGDARGTSPYSMGVTLGELKANASISVMRIYRDQFLQLVENGTPGFMDKFFGVSMTYQEVGWDKVEIDSFDARITGAGHEYQAGNSPLMVKFPLFTHFVILNGHIPIQGAALV